MSKEARFFTKARNRAGLTQSEVANKLGWDNGQFISNIERGVCGLPNESVRAFCKLTGASVIAYLRLKIAVKSKEIRAQIMGYGEK